MLAIFIWLPFTVTTPIFSLYKLSNFVQSGGYVTVTVPLPQPSLITENALKGEIGERVVNQGAKFTNANELQLD